MAKRNPRQRRGKYIKGNVNEVVVLGTLAGLTLTSAIFDEAVNQRTLISSLEATYSLADFTDGVGDGPIEVGVAHSDYTNAEIEAVIESTGSWDEGNLVDQEIAKRKVRKIGIFETDSAVTVANQYLNDGMPVKTKLNWILNEDDTLTLWAYNLGAGALATGSAVHCDGHANLWPQ